MQQLSETIQEMAEKAGGTWGIVLEDLDRQEKWQWNDDEVFNAASLIKIPIMIAAYDQLHREKIKLSQQLTLEYEDIVGGSGVLQHLLPGLSLSVYDLIVLMIIQSDNTATNMLIDFLGKREIQQTMINLGLEKSQLHNRLMVVPVKKEGNNATTAQEMHFLLKQMVTGNIISSYACEQMIGVMKQQQIQESLAGKLLEQETLLIGGFPAWEFAHKTGNITKVRHDVGIFFVEGRTFVTTILSKGIDDVNSMLTFQDIGLKIVDYLKKDKGTDHRRA